MLLSIDSERIKGTFRSKHWSFSYSVGDPCSALCIDELRQRLPHIDALSWDERFALGGIYVNGGEATPETPLTPPCRLQYFEPIVELERLSTLYPQFTAEHVIYRDEDLAVVFKPCGLPTTAPRDQRRFTMQRYLDDFFGRPVHLPSRLDAAVAGIIPVSLSSRMNRYLQGAYVRRAVEKRYLAEVSGCFSEDPVTFNAPIGRDERHPILRRVVHAGGEEAFTTVTKIATLHESRSSLLEVSPITGRTHQIRVHLAYHDFPIVGDPFYGGAEAEEIRLICYALRFHHPFINTMIDLAVPETLRPSWVREAFQRGHETKVRCESGDIS